MYFSLFDAVFADSFFSPMRTVYVVSDSQLEEIKSTQREEELENIETSRKRLEESYQTRLKVLYDREHELQEEIKADCSTSFSSRTSQPFCLLKQIIQLL